MKIDFKALRLQVSNLAEKGHSAQVQRLRHETLALLRVFRRGYSEYQKLVISENRLALQEAGVESPEAWVIAVCNRIYYISMIYGLGVYALTGKLERALKFASALEAEEACRFIQLSASEHGIVILSV